MIDYIKWEINNKCNLNCPYCFLKEETKELDLIDKYIIADKLIQFKPKVIDFFGKEPLYNEDIFKLIDYLEGKVNYSFITNGVNLLKYSKEILKRSERLCQMTISYDCGLKARKFNIDLSKITNLTDKVYTELTLDTHLKNIDDVLREVKTFRNYGIESTYINPIENYGNSLNAYYSLNEKMLEDLIKELIKIEHLLTNQVLIRVPFSFAGLTKKYQGVTLNKIEFITEPKCNAGDNNLYVSSDGNVYGCVNAQNNKYKANLFYDSPEEILQKIKCNTGRACCEVIR